jgi:protein-disulfide isomerase
MKRILRWSVCLLGLMLPLVAQEKLPPAPALPSEETVNSFLQQSFGYEPTVQWKVVSIQPASFGLAEVSVILINQGQQSFSRLWITPDGKHALVGEVIPFGARPYAEAKQQLSKATGPAHGPAEAPVTVVEFSDFQCPHCKDAQPAVEKLFASQPNVRFVFQNFPLPSHDWAMKAASYADCASRGNADAYWKFVGAVFATQADITASTADEKLTSIADNTGLKGAEIATCAAKPETQVRVQASVDFGKQLEVTSTPTFFINGRRIADYAHLPDDILNKMIEFHAKEGK